MPYKDKAVDAERKRIARQRAYRPDAPGFQAWFVHCVAELRETGLTRSWSDALRDAIGLSEEDDRRLRRYITGEVDTPRPQSAYEIGWGLYSLGITWCSGPMALLAAGHIPELFALVGVLSGVGETARLVALRLAFAGDRANAILARERRRIENAIAGGLRQRRDFARTAVALTVEERVLIDEAWRKIRLAKLRRLPMLPEYRAAYSISSIRALDQRTRMYGALAIIARATCDPRSDRPREAAIVAELEKISPIAVAPLRYEVSS